MTLTRPFIEKLDRAQQESRSLLCVGLDPDPDRIPPSLLAASSSVVVATSIFCRRIIEATASFACAFKINFAFFEALGPDGWRLLKEVSDEIPRSKIRIADAKRGDIGNTGRFYAQAVFERLDFDACTVAPYMGRSSVLPFLQYPEKAAFVLTRTSNPDADEVQAWPSAEEPLYRRVGQLARTWQEGCPGTAGFVVGATDVDAMVSLRADAPNVPFLVPGVGAQGGQLEAVLSRAATDRGRVIVNSSRGILYASPGSDFTDAAARSAEMLRDQMRAALPA